MADQKSTAAVRKRAQIAKANRTMFLWIAVCSAVVGAAVVVAYFLVQTLLYNEKLIAEKNNTVSVLEKNLEVIPELQTQVRVLDTNADLAAAKSSEDDRAIRVILDALPSDANSLALGASLQGRLLTGVDGLTLESLQVDPVVGVESLSNGSVVNAGSGGSSDYQITFRFSVSGSPEALKEVLDRLERSIRLIDVRSMRIETQSNNQVMTINARAFYEPAKTLELTNKAVQR
jgi:hypothetical protein